MGDLAESFWLYGRDGAKYRAYIHQERITASSMDGPGSILGPKTAPPGKWSSVELCGRQHIPECGDGRTADAQGRGPEEARVGEDEDLEK